MRERKDQDSSERKSEAKMLSGLRYEDIENKYALEHHEVFKGTTPATAANFSVFFNALYAVEVAFIAVSFTTASSSGTLQIEKLTGTQAPGAGTSILKAAISLSGTANTLVWAVQRDMTSARALDIGDRLAFVDGGTLTGLTDLVVSIYYKPRGRGDFR